MLGAQRISSTLSLQEFSLQSIAVSLAKTWILTHSPTLDLATMWDFTEVSQLFALETSTFADLFR